MANPDAYDEKYAKWNMADLPIFGATTSMKQQRQPRSSLTSLKS